MAVIIGSIVSFTEGSTWSEYLERFDTLMAINKIVDDIARSMYLITFGGPILYSKMRDICAPVNPAKVKYPKLGAKLNAMMTPKTQRLLKRNVFYERTQKIGESYSDYALALKHLSQSCEFGTMLDSVLSDRFVMGIRRTSTRVAVIRLNKKTFDEVVAEAQAFELTENAESSSSGVHQFKYSNSSSFSVGSGNSNNQGGYNNRHNGGKSGQGSRDCNCGGRTGGHAGKCPALINNLKCEFCRKAGHTKVVCQESLKQAVRRESQINAVDETASTIATLSSGELNFINMLSCRTETKPPEYMYVSLNGVQVRFEIDTGACSTVFEHTFRKYFPHLSLTQVADNGIECVILGKAKVLVNERFPLEIRVMQSSSLALQDPLIERTWLVAICQGKRNYFSHIIYFSLSPSVTFYETTSYHN